MRAYKSSYLFHEHILHVNCIAVNEGFLTFWKGSRTSYQEQSWTSSGPLYDYVAYNREGYSEKNDFIKVLRKVARNLRKDGVVTFFSLRSSDKVSTNCPGFPLASGSQTLQNKYDKQCLLKNVVVEYVNIVTISNKTLLLSPPGSEQKWCNFILKFTFHYLHFIENITEL